MKSIRIIDRLDAGFHSSGTSGGGGRSADGPVGKRSVEDMRAFFWSGPGWDAAFKEAKQLLDEGATIKDAASSVGWTEKTLREALAGSGHPSLEEIGRAPPPRPRIKRTLKQRVEGLADVPSAMLKKAKRLYEVEYCTVRETAKILGLPYERTYLVLIRAGTRFRRPGRRATKGERDR